LDQPFCKTTSGIEQAVPRLMEWAYQSHAFTDKKYSFHAPSGNGHIN